MSPGLAKPPPASPQLITNPKNSINSVTIPGNCCRRIKQKNSRDSSRPRNGTEKTAPAGSSNRRREKWQQQRTRLPDRPLRRERLKNGHNRRLTPNISPGLRMCRACKLLRRKNKTSIISERFAGTLSVSYFEYDAMNGWELRISNGDSFNRFGMFQEGEVQDD